MFTSERHQRFILLCLIWLLGSYSTVFAQKSKENASTTSSATVQTHLKRINQELAKAQDLLNKSPEKAMRYVQKALIRSQKHKYTLGEVKALGLWAEFYMTQTLHEKALEYFLNQLKLYKKLNNTLGIAHVYNRIALLYRRQRLYKKTIEYSELVLQIALKHGYRREVGAAHNNLGVAFLVAKDFKKAFQYLAIAIREREALKDTLGLIISYNNMGLTFGRQDKVNEAMKWYQKSLSLYSKEVGFQNMKSAILDNVGDMMAKRGLHKEAQTFYQKALAIAQENHDKIRIIEAYESMFNLAVKEKRFKDALTYHQKGDELKDSVYSANIELKITTQQQAYEIAAERSNRAVLERDIKLQQSTIHRQRIISISAFAGLFLVVLFAVVIFRSRLKERKSRALVDKQAAEIQEVNRLLMKSRGKLLTRTEMLTLRNQQVTTSIRAAQLIQSAILPFEKRLQEVLGEHFLIYLPKDIVSGDFYWIRQVDEKRIVAVADCTGHGVAGSLMATLGYALLNEIIGKGVCEPAMILEELNEKLTATLRQEVTKNQAGMDIVLCKIEPEESEQNQKTTHYSITHASSRRPLYYTQKQKLIKVKGDKQYIGGRFNRYEPRPFEQHQIVLSKGETLYLTTDGFADTPNIERESFGSQQFFDMLNQYKSYPLEEQKNILLEAHYEHQQDVEQRDDITILGFKL